MFFQVIAQRSPQQQIVRDLQFRLAIDRSFPQPEDGVSDLHIKAVVAGLESPSQDLVRALDLELKR